VERHRHKSTTASRVPPGLTTLQQKAWIKSQKKLSLACAAVAKMEDDAEIQPEPELEAQHAAVSSGVELQRQAIETGLTFGDVRGKSDGEIRAFMRALKIDTRPSTSSPELQQEPRVLEVKPRSQAREETVKARSATSAAASVPVEVSETGSLLQTLQREVDKLALELMATVKRQMLDTEAKLGANMVTQLAILKADLANSNDTASDKVPLGTSESHTAQMLQAVASQIEPLVAEIRVVEPLQGRGMAVENHQHKSMDQLKYAPLRKDIVENVTSVTINTPSTDGPQRARQWLHGYRHRRL
jgi:hypothetical protein